MRKLFFFIILLVLSPVSYANLIPNGDFEQGMTGWSSFWTREANTGKAQIVSDMVHSGSKAIQIDYSGQEDWSFGIIKRIPVQEGDVFTFDAWVKSQGEGSSSICVELWGKDEKIIDWAYGERSVSKTQDWTHLISRFVIPANAATIHPRIIGYKSLRVWADDFSLVKDGNVKDWLGALPKEIKLENPVIAVKLDANKTALSVTDKRNGKKWEQAVFTEEGVPRDIQINGNRIEIKWLHFPSNQEYLLTYELDKERTEIAFTMKGQGELKNTIPFPHPFVTQVGTYLVIPMNEGISYPVDDKSINQLELVGYGGHGICMGFWGVTDGQSGQMAIIESPDDMRIRIARRNSLLCVEPLWEDQKGQFGYDRKLRYVFFDQGGHTAIAKRYREYAQNIGLFKTLKQKRQEIPAVDLLVGAVNVWCWDNKPLEIIDKLQKAGIEHILWSNRSTPENIDKMNQMEGVLSSRYDIYQDCMNPANFPQTGTHPDWTTDGWPKDIMLDQNGDWIHGWGVEGKDGKMYDCGVLCDKQAPAYAKKRVPEDLKDHHYRCRFIDTTTASPWRECYDPNHPLTRSESKFWKMELLRYMSEDQKLVTGCETGHDASVPYLHYFEGMLSLGPYRVDDAGRDMQKIVNDVPEQIAKFQVGQQYRLPLWELVYHDCVVAQWYWGDYNNKLPAVWDKRDLFNLLYGTPPMFMFDRAIWEQNKDRFAQSYKAICPVVKQIGYEEMESHSFLTPDRNVQQTVFSDGTTITVNFGATPFALPSGEKIAPMGSAVIKNQNVKCNEWIKQN